MHSTVCCLAVAFLHRPVVTQWQPRWPPCPHSVPTLPRAPRRTLRWSPTPGEARALPQCCSLRTLLRYAGRFSMPPTRPSPPPLPQGCSPPWTWYAKTRRTRYGCCYSSTTPSSSRPSLCAALAVRRQRSPPPAVPVGTPRAHAWQIGHYTPRTHGRLQAGNVGGRLPQERGAAPSPGGTHTHSPLTPYPTSPCRCSSIPVR